MNATPFLLLVMMLQTSLQTSRETVDGEITKHIETLTSSDNKTPDELKAAVDGQLDAAAAISFAKSPGNAKLMAQLDGVFCVQKILLYTNYETDDPHDFVCTETGKCPGEVDGQKYVARVEQEGEVDVSKYKDCETGYLGNAFYVERDEEGNLNVFDLAVVGTATGKIISLFMNVL